MIRALFMLTIVSFTLLSCKKDYTCSCEQTYVTTAYTQYGVFHPQSTTASTFKNSFKDKEDKAKKSCKNFENYQVDTYGSGESQRTATTIVKCELY